MAQNDETKAEEALGPEQPVQAEAASSGVQDAGDPEEPDMEEVCFEIIANVGMAKSMYIDAISKAKEGKFDEARDLVKQGSDAYLEGHNVHLKLLANDAGGRSVHFSMLLMHAEDQLLGAETFRIVADDFIDVYEKLAKLEA